MLYVLSIVSVQVGCIHCTLTFIMCKIYGMKLKNQNYWGDGGKIWGGGDVSPRICRPVTTPYMI